MHRSFDAPRQKAGLAQDRLERGVSRVERRPHRMAVLAVAAGLLASGCYGSFTLTRKVYNWNGQVSDNQWVVEAVFLVCAWLPVYGIASLADAVIFNSVEFWTGKSLLETATGHQPMKRLVRNGVETVWTRDGKDMLIEQFQHGRPIASLRLRREGDVVLGLNPDGATLFSAQTRPDGTVEVTGASGQQVASYSAQDVQQFLTSLPQ